LRFDESNRERFASYRADCQESNAAFFDMLRAEHLTLATDQLGYFAHWITPEEQPLRFDTRFFVAMAPLGQEPEVDGHEIVNLRWLSPKEVEGAIQGKEITLRTPTLKNLELVAAYPSAPEAVAGLGPAGGSHDTAPHHPGGREAAAGPARRPPLVLRPSDPARPSSCPGHDHRDDDQTYPEEEQAFRLRYGHPVGQRKRRAGRQEKREQSRGPRPASQATDG
jgi:hypothetical protein